jgi:hypothetical protein
LLLLKFVDCYVVYFRFGSSCWREGDWPCVVVEKERKGERRT